MNKTARHVFRLYVIASKVRSLPINAARTCYAKIPALLYSSNSKEHGLRATSETMKNKKKDEIVTSILMANNPEDIFRIVKQYHTLMKAFHSLQALRQLYFIYKSLNVTDVPIHKKAEFIQLCQIVVSNLKSLHVNDAVYILKVCTHFGVPSTSLISQSLLQFISQAMGHVAFHQLMMLQKLLKDFESTPLSDALLIAIPILCEIQLDNKMIDFSSLSILTQAMLFLTNKPNNYQIIEKIVDAVREQGVNINVTYARNILQHMCDLQYLPPGYEDVLSNLQQILILNVHKVSLYTINVLLGKIVKQVCYRGNQAFYNEEFVDMCAETIISRNGGFATGVSILCKLCKLNYTHIRLIDYLAAKCFENSEVLSQSIHDDIILVIGLAMADYKPIFWEKMQKIIVKNVAKSDFDPKTEYMDYVVSMAALDFFDVRLIKKVFSEIYLHSKSLKDTCWNLLLLYQSVKTFCPEYAGPWPLQHTIDDAINNNSLDVNKPSLLSPLEKALGGSQYVLSDLRSKIGHKIDHVVVMRKGRYPVALNSLEKSTETKPIMYIEDLQLPADSQVIIIINLPAHAYAINSHRLKGTWTLLLKTLETHTRHTVIPINSMMWTELADHEKIPYLMQAIRLKCDDMAASGIV